MDEHLRSRFDTDHPRMIRSSVRCYALWTFADSRSRMKRKTQRKLGNFSIARVQANRLFYPNQTSPDEVASWQLPKQDALKKAFKKTQRGRRAFIVLCSIFLIMWAVPSVM
ncbi:hypothetical protein EMMF5_003045 [Cystobasidiomycetes sp. EMM_F5]